MAKPKTKHDDAAEDPQPQDSPVNASDDETSDDEVGIDQELTPEQTLQAELDETQSRLLRTTADYQNYVRRSQQNVEAARQQALLDVARSLVAVMDHFDQALAVDAEQTNAKSLLDGMTIVHDELVNTLNRFGVERIDTEPGDAFDPNLHEAMLQQPAEGVGSGDIALQIQPGYVLDGKTVRPAKVAVAP